MGPPEQYELPITNSAVTGKVCFWKNPFNETFVSYRFSSSTSDNSIGDLAFATLPVGFRPLDTTFAAVAGAQVNTARIAGWGAVSPNGQLSVSFGSLTKAKEAYGLLSFLAEQ